ncbi:MAG: GNAT family N-acetyltransferase [Alphaproteobacteria bacterium]
MGRTIIRRARVEDAAAIARVHVDSWRSTYAGMLPGKMLLKLSSAEHEKRWWGHVLGRFRRNHFVYVAENETDGVIGFGSAGASRDRELDHSGEIYALYVLDEYQGMGVGKALFLALGERLLDERGPSLMVWVLSTNPSRYFYETLGGRRIATRKDRMGGVEIEETAYGWKDVSLLAAADGTDGIGRAE